MLGVGEEIISTYVTSGQAKIIFWPMLDIGPNSEKAAAAAYCVGQQDVEAYWRYHDYLFAEQPDVYRADDAYFVETAVQFGIDPDPFQQCYADPTTGDLLRDLNEQRLDAGIFNRPTILVGEQRFTGVQPFSTYQQTIEAQLP